MKAREYVKLQVERTRGQLRATVFIRLNNNSLALRGKTLREFVDDLLAIGNKPVELVDAKSVLNLDDRDLIDGDIVSKKNAFTTIDGMVWDGTNLRFQTANGAVVSYDQYEYLHNQALGPAQIFAEIDQDKQTAVKTAWKSMSRIAKEARSDKAKEIFYLTFGELFWDANPGKKDSKKSKSPLFLMQIKEETTSDGMYKFKIPHQTLKPNSVLRREVMKQTGVNIYEDCAEEIHLQDLEKALEEVEKTVRDYFGAMRVEADAYHVCILDSHYEGVCQFVEKNADAISESELVKMLSGECCAEQGARADTACGMILPLPADESQKKVIEAVLTGQSVYAPAPAGAGKSQTSVNIAANLAIKGKSVCVMSEKLAANEVFLEYARKIGLDKYCLSVNSNMKTADIVRQIKSIAKLNCQYVQTAKAKETVERYAKAVREYERLNTELYQTDPALKISLYDLIAVAVTASEMASFDIGQLNKSDYLSLKNSLLDIQSGCFEIMTDDEFDRFFYRDSCADLELHAMLNKALQGIIQKGIALPDLIRANNLKRENAVKSILANLARKIAVDMIGEKNLFEIGNRKIKSTYKLLADAHLQMQELYGSYLHQELSTRISKSIDDKFIQSLDKLKVTKVTPQELFAVYGKEIRAICPIIITTPTAAINYIYDTGLDHFYTMIVDEASQMQIISILPYADRMKQLVVFGDSMQLGITSTFMKKDLANIENSLNDTAYADRSVLQAVQGRLPSYSLKYHYRSASEMLIHVSNQTCYDGLLETIPDIFTTRDALPNYLGLEVIQVEPPEPGKKGENISEATEIASRVAALRNEHPDKSIGIIAFNERQQELISDMLEEVLGGYVDNTKLWVRALENAQGKEADFIFISIGHFRRNRDGSLHSGISEINHVGGENRLNVLFTRARCKNFIVLSFDYKELKRSDNSGIKRLYQYLEYAVNGKLNESNESRLRDSDHAMVRCVAERLESINPLYKASTCLGSNQLTVDIAIREHESASYSLGILMPSFAQTAQETMTKVAVLERAGWHVSPVSPIWFLISEEVFKEQIAKDLRQPISFTSSNSVCFDTNRKPDVLFGSEDLITLDIYKNSEEISPISEEEFLAMDLKECYKNALSEDFWRKDERELNRLAKKGNTEANLALLILLKDSLIGKGKRRTLLSHIGRLYSVQNERRAGFFFAQMLRIDDVGHNKKLIQNLLMEAHELGIGGV